MIGKDIRIVFFGTPEFAVAQLDELIQENYNVVGVVTTPDKPAGRGLKIIQSAVKQYAVQHNLPVLQPDKLKSEDFLTQLAALKADLQIVIAFRMLPQVVYCMPRLGTFNLHASLLPKYRGAAPINWAIINGETQTGLTTFLLNDKIDEGEIILQQPISIEKEDTAETLHDKMMNQGRKLVTKTINLLVSGKTTTKLQDNSDSAPSFAPKIFKETTLIAWNKNGEEIVNFIRGLSAYPAATTVFFSENDAKEYSFKVFKAIFLPNIAEKKPGIFSIEKNSQIRVSCLNGEIQLIDLQLSGKKRMNAEKFIRGWKLDTKLFAK
jgi:methionyl-tRNA formyltransferase